MGDVVEPPVQQQSTAQLVKLVSQQVSALVRDELKLAQLEMTRKGKAAAFGAGALGGSGMVAFYALGALVACAILALSLVVSAWLAALIVAGGLGAVAAVMALTGVGRLRRATPPVPSEAVADVKADLEEIKEGIRR